MKKIKIKFSGNTIEAELNNTRISKKIWDLLPLESVINTWGEEIFFNIPVEGKLENGKEVLAEGDIAFWPPGNAFCIFFGPTPISTDERPRAAGPVTLLGRILKKSDLNVLRSASDGLRIYLVK